MEWTPDRFWDALARNEFGLLFQPQMAADGRRLVGVEALVRRVTADGEVTEPGQFIPDLERLGLIGQLSRHLFPTLCAAARRWPTLTVAFNISPREFREVDLARFLVATAEAAGADRRRLEIEITEGLFFDDTDRAETTLRELRAAGFAVALDDFGTGYASLAYLLRFPVDKIKIDRSFVQDVPQSMKASAIVQALIALARDLGLSVVAEGVETEPQRAFLKAAGCHRLQGFLFSPPVDAAAIDAMLAADMPAPVA